MPPPASQASFRKMSSRAKCPLARATSWFFRARFESNELGLSNNPISLPAFLPGEL